jgi:aryl-alcohol dehydrogenase-like predicted oxidoreductase/predicted kinase
VSTWLERSELRVGLGCMRLPVAEPNGEEVAVATLRAALDAGVTVFDTAHAYGPTAADFGANERLLARGLRVGGGSSAARIVTKGGMSRVGRSWVPDGRARTLLRDCEGSLAALDGLPIDLYLLHAPDPRTSWRTSVRALRRLLDERLVARVGVCNVNAQQLEEALDLAPIAAVQVGLSLLDDGPARGGVLALAERRGVWLIAHSPLGGPRRRTALARSAELAAVAAELGATPAEVALAWLLRLSPLLVPIAGARRPESARSAARAAQVPLSAEQAGRLATAFGLALTGRVTPRSAAAAGAQVLLVMGIPGAGKTRVAGELARRGYRRLNRDERGGTLAELAAELDAQLAAGVPLLVLDNTYLTRASRSRVLEVAAKHGATVRCLWLDTPLAQAQVNVVERLLDRFGSLPDPEALRRAARGEPGLHTPTSQMRTLRELEPPAADEGFSEVERRPFARAAGGRARAGLFVAASAAAHPDLKPAVETVGAGAPLLLFDWLPGAGPDALASQAAGLAEEVSGPVATAVCGHPGGPPICWCRPPLPGLLLGFARVHDVDPARSAVVGTTPTHRALAQTLGARYVALEGAP